MQDHFNKHDAYSRYLAYKKDKPVAHVKPSPYITGVKLKKAIKTLTDEEIEELYGDEMEPVIIAQHREKLREKIAELHEWQLNEALRILYEDGNSPAFRFILHCKKEEYLPPGK